MPGHKNAIALKQYGNAEVWRDGSKAGVLTAEPLMHIERYQ